MTEQSDTLNNPEILDHPAVQANIQSMKFAMAKDKESWLALFDDNAVVRDPVGKSPLDPVGDGHQGKEKIGAFFDMMIAPANLKLTPKHRYTSGDHHCAVAIHGDNEMGGKQTSVDMLVVYEVNDAGKIVSLSAYWSWSDLEKQLAS